MSNAIRYNVVCGNCGMVFVAREGSSAWNKADEKAKLGYLDAAVVPGEECGCIEPIQDPNAPYRVSGWDDMGCEFDAPFHSLLAATRFLILCERTLCTTIFVDREEVKGTISNLHKRIKEIARRIAYKR